VARLGAKRLSVQAPVATTHAALAAAGAVLLAMAAGFAALVAADPAHPLTFRLDRAWRMTIEPARGHLLTQAAKIVSLVGGPTGGTVIVIAVAAFLWFARGRRVGAAFLVATLAVTSGASQLIKHVVQRPRPPGALVSADIGSFPSGHVITALAVGVALVLVLTRPGHRRLPLAIVAVITLLMMWCRTYLGAHWLSDTFESVLVASGLVLVGWASAGPYVERERDAACRHAPVPAGGGTSERSREPGREPDRDCDT
jgi:membrane-associated phospholipid phosphatase